MTHIKICGIRSFEDAQAAVEAGADYLGFNFFRRSARFIEIAPCRKIAEMLKIRYPDLRFVGVFVNTPLAEIIELVTTCMLDKVQMHGDESPLMIREMKGVAYKAFRGTPRVIADYLVPRAEPAFLLDADASQAYGGTGKLSNWQDAERLAKQVPLFLAGGLNPENVADAIRQVAPWGVDVASGVESMPGVKDRQKMQAFIKAVRLADLESSLISTKNALVEES